MQFDPLQIVFDIVWGLPFWTKALLVLLVVMRIGWPELVAERETAPRRRRWRRRNRWNRWDD
jgi:hypothetical protein